MTVTALIVAAGRGTRAGGDRPKQYQALMGRAILGRTLAAFAAHPRVDALVAVLHPDDDDLFAEAVAGLDLDVTTVHGGATRDASVQAGLAAVADESGLVLIHDGARPLVAPDLIDRVIDALADHPGAAPALPVTDALWRGADGKVQAPHPRDGLFRAQTPQGFHLRAIRAAHDAHPGGAADDVEVALAAGLDVAIVQGDEDNLKITHPEDFARAARVLRERDMDIRTGNGFDVHAFCEGDGVILCGVKVPHDKALKGHSDADVGMHAVTDAIYGALADGDIGQHFPPSDPQWKGAPSDIFLKHAVALAGERGYRISNADLTLICERPKIGPVAGAMRAEMARLIGIDLDRISVKATTSEQLGFTGRQEGIAALATVTLVKP
ncbi:bifunctional 2-C-methyl-D-erythritol 4-phosphate cytidylyltransferase/2-C-methyl-D-erythritol 2,4-cyclodiphosphate synthase [Rhodovulum adriaticum]|uniref:Bifunctional enzyme IspD/IspF n=1 Tax=Rhodovulum adriaticum TaxID=35804 RepID=A0A4R2NTP4_RHOAD|nr:bifunctional 2-C-methyl-D-erythritol 4-phosphate cytidylyltransferase/2-C-methyl-D-erythritol 2,4-cyclodiphosphate synthase [Rhodovulum adriaticum]MBK1635046.1 bifunctional 2-C-methyl-D-erythritol 4-phosphate cytidylyltransferase/2-C-methyl-D-erythritol 2,4-cyclodiphosphate synthase [Rhodovulum adriaticum]TCP25320.1 2-C-methyl-D-erythritol 2,4-cyclodiphosphate synthase [Rhodovulum adriaticum]